MARNSLTDLLAQKAALDQKIADMQRATRGDAVAKVKALMAEYGLTAADIGGASSPSAPGPATGKRAAKAANPPSPFKAKRSSANAGKKVAPKYRNPATGDTWSGRGLKPKWLTAALSSGRALTEFAL